MTYAPGEPWLFWLWERLQDPQFEPHVGIKMAQVLGSSVYIYGVLLSQYPWQLLSGQKVTFLGKQPTSSRLEYLRKPVIQACSHVCWICYLQKIHFVLNYIQNGLKDTKVFRNNYLRRISLSGSLENFYSTLKLQKKKKKYCYFSIPGIWKMVQNIFLSQYYFYIIFLSEIRL